MGSNRHDNIKTNQLLYIQLNNMTNFLLNNIHLLSINALNVIVVLKTDAAS